CLPGCGTQDGGRRPARNLQAIKGEGARPGKSISEREGAGLPLKIVRLIAPSLMLLFLVFSSIRAYPPGVIQFTDITEKAGIKFKHVASPEKKYIVESMSGGVALIDYDNDGYQDIFFVNALTLDLLKSGGKTTSALYHNNGDGTFTDVTAKSGLADVGW